MNNQRQSVIVEEVGDPQVMRVRAEAIPTPGAGEIVVDVAAAGVNFIDTYERSGLYPVPTPFIVGSEGAGVVTAVADDVSEIAVGDRVAWAGITGSGYTTHAVLPATRAVPVPTGVDIADAAAVMLQGMTAHYLCTASYPVQPGDVVLVHAAAGGVGLLLTQLIKLRGGIVIGTTSTSEKEELARAAGADHVIRYTEADIAAEVRRITDGEGVAAVYDGVGKSTFEASLDSLRVRGTMVLFGAASGPVPPFDPQILNAKGSLTLTRPKLGDFVRDRAELLQRAGDLFEWLADGELSVRISHRYPLEQAAQAHEDLTGRRTTGKLLIIPQ